MKFVYLEESLPRFVVQFTNMFNMNRRSKSFFRSFFLPFLQYVLRLWDSVCSLLLMRVITTNILRIITTNFLSRAKSQRFAVNNLRINVYCTYRYAASAAECVGQLTMDLSHQFESGHYFVAKAKISLCQPALGPTRPLCALLHTFM